MTISFKDIADILKSVDDSNAQHIEIDVEGLRLVVHKHGAPALNPASASPAETKASAPVDPEPTITPSEEPAPAAEPPVPDGYHAIRSPMVGTFYRRPSPEAAPFVEPGTKVGAGDPLCLIEVMKLYTTVESTVHGTVASVLAEDGSLVEFNQQLFSIKVE